MTKIVGTMLLALPFGMAGCQAAPPPDLTLNSENSKTVWSTSQYSYGAKGRSGGAGQSNDKLRVGGWGDRYVSLIQFDLPSPQMIKQATLRLHIATEDGQPTGLIVARARTAWTYKEGDPMWWMDLPTTEIVETLPPPTRAQEIYEIDITDVYKDWITGRYPNNGIVIYPTSNNNNYTTFYSSRAKSDQRPVVHFVY